jgi:hypothetical protein
LDAKESNELNNLDENGSNELNRIVGLGGRDGGELLGIDPGLKQFGRQHSLMSFL